MIRRAGLAGAGLAMPAVSRSGCLRSRPGRHCACRCCERTDQDKASLLDVLHTIHYPVQHNTYHNLQIINKLQHSLGDAPLTLGVVGQKGEVRIVVIVTRHPT